MNETVIELIRIIRSMERSTKITLAMPTQRYLSKLERQVTEDRVRAVMGAVMGQSQDNAIGVIAVPVPDLSLLKLSFLPKLS